MKYVYPVIMHEEDKKTLVSAPDLPGLHTYGIDLAEALEMGKDAMEMWLCEAEDQKWEIPSASKPSALRFDPETHYTSLVTADTEEWRKKHDSKAVNKMVTLPSWLNRAAKEVNAPFSQILQQGLKAYLGIE